MRLLSALFIIIVSSASCTASAQLRPMIYAEVTVNGTPEDVFADWTTGETIEAFFAPQATIDATPGGLYELCFAVDAPKGSCGNDDGRLLALQPGEMISFTWAMPPYMPEIRPHLTVVQIMFEAQTEETTRVRLFHTGFGTGEQWDNGRAYFQKTWPAVLSGYKDYRLKD